MLADWLALFIGPRISLTGIHPQFKRLDGCGSSPESAIKVSFLHLGFNQIGY
jgi:hypothetical protein